MPSKGFREKDFVGYKGLRKARTLKRHLWAVLGLSKRLQFYGSVPEF